MAEIIKNTLVVDSPKDLEAEMCRYNCHTREELEDTLRNDYNTVLVLTYEYEEA